MSITFSEEDYVVPQWAGDPRYEWQLEVIKGGSSVGLIPIRPKSVNLVGRLEELSDIHIDNQTVSRKHAIFQFAKEQDTPYLYDLGSPHGTRVNKQQLPKRIYKRLSPFDSIKFGQSSRNFVLRCPQLEKKQLAAEEQEDNSFMKAINEQKKQVSMEQMKKIYLQLLESSSWGPQIASRKFQGKQEDNFEEGINWGIQDECQVYNYHNESQYSLQPDLMRRLPGLDPAQLKKIADYQTALRIYEEIENELNELAHHEKKHFGLEQSQAARKEKLESKIVEALQTLNKAEEWIRFHLFGETPVHQEATKRVKDKDTYSDDEFMDRTLADRKTSNSFKHQVVIPSTNAVFTTEDFWSIKKQYEQLLKERMIIDKESKTLEKQAGVGEGEEDVDELDAYMRQNNQELQKENKNLFGSKLEELQLNIKIMKQKLLSFISLKEVDKIQASWIVREKRQDFDNNHELVKAQIQKQENNRKMTETLQRLERRKQQLQQLPQEDPRIFQYYAQDAQLQQLSGGKRIAQYQEQISEYSRPKKKIQIFTANRKDEANQEEQIDLTRLHG